MAGPLVASAGIDQLSDVGTRVRVTHLNVLTSKAT